MLPELATIPDQIEALATEGRTRGKRWSLAQITDHLARAIEWQLRLLPGEGPIERLPPLFIRVCIRELVMLTRRMPPRVPIINPLAPPAEADLQTALKRLRNAINAMESAEEPMLPHEFFGNMPRRRWLRFHAIHARHHLKTVPR